MSSNAPRREAVIVARGGREPDPAGGSRQDRVARRERERHHGRGVGHGLEHEEALARGSAQANRRWRGRHHEREPPAAAG